jgi:Xaa-Pro aminopeptidase
MISITSNFQTIYKETGLNVEEDLLYVRLNLDSPHVSSPLLVRKNDTAFLLVRDGERGNFKEANIPATIRFFNKYEKFNEDEDDLPRDWTDILSEIAVGQTVEVDDGMPVGTVIHIADVLSVELNPTREISEFFSYEVEKDAVRNVFAACYDEGLRDARKLMTGLKRHKELSRLLDELTPEDRFSYIDAIADDLKLDAILFSSPLNVQEVTGIPYEYLKTHEVIAVYSVGTPVKVLSYSPLDFSHLRLNGIHKNVQEVVSKSPIHHEIIGIEEDHLPYRYARALDISCEDLIPLGEKLRYWRECRAWEELPFYIIAAQATISGIDSALTYANEQIATSGEFTEKNIQRHLYWRFARFISENDLHGRIVPYFIVLHAGQRTTYPSKPSFDVLKGQDTKTVRLDCGVFVIDDRGLLRATSDICRTLVLCPEAKELLDYLKHMMVSKAVPAVMPRRKGGDVYREGVSDMFSSDPSRWIARGLLPVGGIKRYRRHIGHVMGKQEPATVVFEEKNEGVLRDGMVCCIEYHWLRWPYAIGVEDMFFVTSEGPVNITH